MQAIIWSHGSWFHDAPFLLLLLLLLLLLVMINYITVMNSLRF